MQHSSAAAKLIQQMFRQDSHRQNADLAAQNAVVTAALLQNAGFAAPHTALIAAVQQNAGLAAQNASFTAALQQNAGFAQAAVGCHRPPSPKAANRSLQNFCIDSQQR